jgi:hypothetical protein
MGKPQVEPQLLLTDVGVEKVGGVLGFLRLRLSHILVEIVVAFMK